jgi:O-antigen ligase
MTANAANASGRAPRDPAFAAAAAAFFVVVQLYTSLDALAPTPPVGYVFASRAGAAGLVAILVVGAAVGVARLARAATSGTTALAPVVLRGFGPWLGATALASLLGVAPLDGLQIVAVMLLGVAFSAALVRCGSAGVCRAAIVAYLASGIVFCLGALVMLVLREPVALSTFNHGRAAGFFVTANQFAAYLILLGPIAAGVAAASDDRRLRALAVTALALAVPSLLATYSRAGWIGGVAAFCVLAFALGARRVGVATALAGAVGAVILARRPLALNHNPSESLNRIEIWRGGVRAIELFPLTGAGPMGYWRVYPALRLPDGDLPGTFGALHPHNVVLSLAADLGLVGLAAVVAGWLQIVVGIRERLRGGTDPAERRRRALIVSGFAAAFAASLVAGMFDTIGVVQMCFVWIPYAGLALAVAERGIEG